MLSDGPIALGPLRDMRFIRVFKVSPLKTLCLLMDPLFDQNLDDFLGPSIDIRFFGPPKDMTSQKARVY